MAEAIVFIRSKEEEYDAVKSEEGEKEIIADPIRFVNGKALLEAEPLRRRKKRKRRKRKAKQYIEFHVAQAQLNVDNSNHKEDNCSNRGVEMVRLVKTEMPKRDEPQKLEVAPSMLKEQMKVANVERAEALAAGDGPNSVVVIDLSSSGSQSDEGNSRYCCRVGQMVPGVAITGTKKTKDDPQKLEVAPAMLKEQINAANVERAEALAAGNGANSVVVIDLSSSSSQSDDGNSRYCCRVGRIVPEVAITGTKKKKRRRKKSKIIKEETLQAERHEDLETGNFMETESIEIENNILLRQLLRRPRYFDYPGGSWSLCLRCGEESHIKGNCTPQKKKKPCYRCASFEHNGKRCRKRSQDYLNRKEIDSHSLEKLHDQRSISCLRCGDSGHDMFSCGNDYSAEDLKEIQCYVCKSYGHLCCVDFPDCGQIQLSCYNCGQLGHLGSVSNIILHCSLFEHCNYYVVVVNKRNLLILWRLRFKGCPKPCSATNGSKSLTLC